MSETQQTKLLPCPFCGSESIDDEGWKSLSGATGPACDDCSSSADTIERWNTRPREAALVEALEKTQSRLYSMRQDFDNVTSYQIDLLRDQILETLQANASAAPILDRNSIIEECAVAAEQQDRTGREWVSDSLWAKILLRAGTEVRKLKSAKA